VPGLRSADQEALLRAFLAGAGVNDLRIPGGLTPEFMHLLGEVMHEALRGTLELLLARALTKREVRAQATVIVARENNPLKFSPTVEAALANLLSAQSPSQGFMTPVDAIRDAYNDLRSHQFGFMAGMRAALAGVLARFDPAQLEQRLTRKTVMGSVIPSSRRAKLWELYEQLYRDISREADDDFQTLFGREFLRAYEAQIEKLEQEDAGDKR
jgi:FHA domain-containing protein